MTQRIHGWSHGGDPEDFGWTFDETGYSLSAYDVMTCDDREEASDAGVPEAVLDEYESSSYTNTDQYGSGLVDLLQDRYN